MKTIADTSIIDAEISRAHLPSQWPAMIYEWMETGEFGPRLFKALFVAACSIGGLFVWYPIAIALDRAGAPTLGWFIMSAWIATVVSFAYSLRASGPAGVFWILLVIERALPASLRAGHGQRAAPGNPPPAAFPRLPAPDKATADERSRA